MRRCLVLIFVWILAGTLSASTRSSNPLGDPAPFEFLGFSKDGQYLAFTYAGSSAESGEYHSTVVIVDARKNVLIAPINSAKARSLGVAQRKVEAIAQGAIRKLGISKERAGEVFAHSPIQGYNTRQTEDAIKGDAPIIRFAD